MTPQVNTASLADMDKILSAKRRARRKASVASNVAMGRVKISNPIKIEQEHMCTKCCIRVRSKNDYRRAQELKTQGKLVVYYDYYTNLGNLSRWYFDPTGKTRCHECHVGLKIPKDPFPLMLRKELVDKITDSDGDSSIKFIIIRDNDPHNDIGSDWDEHDGVRLVGTNIKLLSSCHPIKMTWAEAVKTREHHFGYFDRGTIRASCDHPDMGGYKSIFDKEKWVFSDFGEAFDHNRLIMGYKPDDMVWLISVYPIIKKSPPQWVDWNTLPSNRPDGRN